MWSRHFTMWFGTPARRWRRDSMYVSSCVRFPVGKIHTRFLGKIRSRFSEKYDFPRKHRPLEITPQLPLALVSGRKRSSQGMVAIGGKEGFYTFFVSKGGQYIWYDTCNSSLTFTKTDRHAQPSYNLQAHTDDAITPITFSQMTRLSRRTLGRNSVMILVIGHWHWIRCG